MQIFKISDKIEVKKSSVCSGKGVFAKRNIRKGELLIDIEAMVVKKRVDYALQIGKSAYLLANYIDNFINHSCSPNVFVKLYENNKNRVSYIAFKNIRKGQELFWNYNTTEWDFGKGFICHCGSKNCIRRVRGMRYLTKLQQKKLAPISTPFIRKKLQEVFRKRSD